MSVEIPEGKFGRMQMVSGMSQRKALNDTALGTANWLVNAANRIKAEMQKQNIERHSKRTPVEGGEKNIWTNKPLYTTDDREPITFERREIRRLLDEMAERVKELRRFETPKVREDD
jgi:hypothetical protein